MVLINAMMLHAHIARGGLTDTMEQTSHSSASNNGRFFARQQPPEEDDQTEIPRPPAV